MNILITNDDGIDSRGIHLLAEWASTLGRVLVVAPRSEQSAKSQSLNIHTSYSVEEVPFAPGILAFAVDSTPADCVLTAAEELRLSFDLVFSGINRGLNISWDIAYSGTCGAVFEAARVGVPGVAFSTVASTFAGAYYHLGDAWDFVARNRLLDIAPLWNINFPAEGQEIRLAYQAGPYLPGLSSLRREGASANASRMELLSDREAIRNGYISVTPLLANRTDLAALSLAGKA